MQESKILRDALLKRALGYEYEEKEITADRNGKPEKIKITKRHVPPDIKAIEKVRYMMLQGLWHDDKKTD